MLYARLNSATIFMVAVIAALGIVGVGTKSYGDLVATRQDGGVKLEGCLSAPLGLWASDGAYADKVRVQWIAVSGASGYEIWRSAENDLGSAVQIATRTWAAFEDRTAAACVTYWYWVRAVGTCGTSDFSAGDSGSAFALPAAPAWLTASDQEYENKVRLDWRAVPGALGYEVWRNTENDLGSAVQIATRTWAACEDGSAVPCTMYWYWVRAVGACGTGEFSDPDTGYVVRLLPAPTGLTASKSTYSDKVRIEWKPVPGALGYEIWRNTVMSLDAAVLIGNRTWTAFEDRSAVVGTTYWYGVRATGACGTGYFATPDWGRRSGDPGPKTVLLPGNVPLELVWIPAGTFMMGRYAGEQDSDANESPQHQVSFLQGFWMGKYEVTQEQWQAVMGSNPSYFLGAKRPVENVSWYSTESFITALNTATGTTFRLPSEAEWEYACRAGTTTRYYWGDDLGCTELDGCMDLGSYAWYWYNSDHQTHEVGGKLPNAWGLYDMIGNVGEWCEDDWHWCGYSGAPVDGGAWVDSPRSDMRLLRGGGWSSTPDWCRSATRNDGPPTGFYQSGGFRVVSTP